MPTSISDLSELYCDCQTEADFNKADRLKQNMLTICELIIEYKRTIRQCADETGLSRSTIHRIIHNKISYYMDEEYLQIKYQLRYNKRYRFRARKYWYR